MATEPLDVRLGVALAPAYELIGPLGAGGMGSVYLARQAGLDRMVAVKVLAEGLATTAAARQRFLREARAVASLTHPNVVAIHAIGELEDGTPYFVMQYVEGSTLAATLRSGPLAIEDARRLVRDVASALQAAHEREIVHRDVKPENILLEGAGQRALLTDFGIAKALGDKEVALTGTRALLGSPLYMSPEQAAGDPVDYRTDLYSLGVVAYHALAGRPPFEGDTLRSLIVQHLTAMPAPVADVRPDCPPDLAAVIERCLAKEPDVRPAAQEVAGVAAGMAVPSAGPEPERPDPVRRFRRLATVAAAGSVAAVGLDLLITGVVGVSIAVVIVATFVVSVRYGSLWTAGYSWRAVVGRQANASQGVVATPAQDGPRAAQVRTARAERGVILRTYQMLSRAEQARFPRLGPTVDRLLARIRKLARELGVLEARISGHQGSSRILGELTGVQEAKSAELNDCEADLLAVREGIERMDAGIEGAENELQAVVQRAAVHLSGGD